MTTLCMSKLKGGGGGRQRPCRHPTQESRRTRAAVRGVDDGRCRRRGIGTRGACSPTGSFTFVMRYAGHRRGCAPTATSACTCISR